MDIDLALRQLAEAGNLRHIPSETTGEVIDLSSNDYIGLAEDKDIQSEFLGSLSGDLPPMSASASRLLGARQREFEAFETLLSDAYGRPALALNSGYHANVGLIQSLADSRTLILADRLVHASIIDGIRLSGAHFERFRHNDYNHLNHIIDRKAKDYDSIIIIAESVYSMDGDRADIERLIEAKRRCPVDTLLYIDEAHAVGALGPAGLGLVADSPEGAEVDIVIGTMGKAIASVGAYAVLSSDRLRSFLVNKARSLIFSTALPPINLAWSRFIFSKMMTMDSRRQLLGELSRRLASALGVDEPSHIRPLIVGDPHKAVALSSQLLKLGYKVLPIRTPTVPPGTERLRFSLSTTISPAAIDRLGEILSTINQSAL